MDPDRLSKAVIDLVDLVSKLRGPGGCPWDVKQTDATIKSYLLEEAYEVLDAIEKAYAPEVCQELGDLLFHILFLARLAEEREEFDFTEVVEMITGKMIRRHPHVFGQATVYSVEDVAVNWARIKKEEKETAGDTASLFGSVPMNLPALLRAHRLSERASKAGIGSPDADDTWDKVLKQFESLKNTVDGHDKERFGREIGLLLFHVVNLSRLWGLNSENLLRAATQEFADRVEEKGRRLK